MGMGKCTTFLQKALATALPASAKTSHNHKATDGGITVMLIEQVPTQLRVKMQLIN
ncbi:hypothetical protein SAMN05421754_11024 [Nitrosomonas sp. Nm58]|jgi:hypothetical protein|nr:hypothetical protein SAMN05421754_11024 [Nitrosomonas sp. Nm58]